MKNREAARYARWSAGIAVAICLVVFGVYLQRRTRGRAQEKNLQPVPAAVAQQSAGFTFSKVVGAQTLFTVRATQATQFKEQSRSLLENVLITIYGTHGERNDSVRADECSYEPETGSIRCQGVVRIALRDVKSNSENGEQLQTSDILFERDSGKVSTDQPVTLQFPGGQGQGVGVLYDPKSEDVTLEKDVALDFAASKKSGGVPVNLSGSALEFRRSENEMRISGPVRVEEGARTLRAGMMEIQLNSAMRPVHALATGEPQVSEGSLRGRSALSAGRMEAGFTRSGTLEKLIADESVHGESTKTDARNASALSFNAQHAEIEMTDENGSSESRTLRANGKVQIETNGREGHRTLNTESLRMEFAPAIQGRGVQVTSAETLAPGEIVSSDSKETARVDAAKFQANFGPQNKLSTLNGSGGVKIVRTPTGEPAQASTAQNFFAQFGGEGQWLTIREGGGVTFEENGKSGRANEAQIVKRTDEVTLGGAASVEDAISQLRAETIRLNQARDEMSAKGNVVTSYFGKQGGTSSPQRTASMGHNAIHISADEMNGRGFTKSQTPQGHAVFSGNARMWAGGSIVQANTIELWQSDERAEARGNVTGEFIELAHAGALPTKQANHRTAPILWQVSAPQADYWNQDGKIEWSGGVSAVSSEGKILAKTLELFFGQGGGQQKLQRAVGTGGVRIEQNGRVGTADRGEYIANEGKFVLSGGQPTIADASGNRTTGHDLVFYLANDAIVVDSQAKPQTQTLPH